MSLTRVVFISPIISFMASGIKELLVIRLVNRYWAESVEKNSVGVWRYLFSKYITYFPNKIYNFIKSKELNRILYIWIDNNIMDVNTLFEYHQEHILGAAVRFNNIFLVEYLIEKDVNIEAKGILTNNTALFLAANGGHKECMSLLLKKGANINAKNYNGSTVLIDAAYHGRKESVSLLLELGMNIEEKNDDGNTALILAAKRGHEECLSLLLEKGANIEEENNYGDTALLDTAYWGRKECMLLLLKKGENSKVTFKHYNTALSYASTYGHNECLLLLYHYS
jgi:ankyrin repeat protein